MTLKSSTIGADGHQSSRSRACRSSMADRRPPHFTGRVARKSQSWKRCRSYQDHQGRGCRPDEYGVASIDQQQTGRIPSSSPTSQPAILWHQLIWTLGNNTWLDDGKGRTRYTNAPEVSLPGAELKAAYRKSDQQTFRVQTPKQPRLSKLDVARYLDRLGRPGRTGYAWADIEFPALHAADEGRRAAAAGTRPASGGSLQKPFSTAPPRRRSGL